MRRFSFTDSGKRLPVGIRHGLKTGLSVVLAYGLTQVLHLHAWHWAVIAALVSAQISAGGAAQGALLRLAGAVMGAALGIALLALFPPGPWWLGTALFCAAAICAALSRSSRSFAMAGLTAAVILLAGASLPEPAAGSLPKAAAVGLGRLLEMLIGIGSALAISIFLWPTRIIDILRRDMAAHFLACAAVLTALITPQDNAPRPSGVELLDKVWKTRAIFLRGRNYESRLPGLARATEAEGKQLAARLSVLEAAALRLCCLEKLLDPSIAGSLVVPTDLQARMNALGVATAAALRRLGGQAPETGDADLTRSIKTAAAGLQARALLNDNGTSTRLYAVMETMLGLAQDCCPAFKSQTQKA